MENTKKYKSSELIKRFLPYYKNNMRVVITDLFCAALTTICEIVLPLIMRNITNTGVENFAALTVEYVLKIGGLYIVLRLIDAAAFYYMSYAGHVMGTKMETAMRHDAYEHLQKLSNTYFSNTKIGQIMGRITNDLFDVTEFSHHCPEEFFIAAIKGVASFLILININVPLTLIIFAIIP
ncbi:MAG: ABC transporter transmembrane domain-containing protein, partial [Acutalibacteraceae bacterium]|nr:ABC transporter transmembrane domain-containing protein [Acutalibacteraceae bacterium]